MSFSREAIARTELFDRNCTGVGSKFGTDSCVRTRRKGFKPLFDPNALVVQTESDAHLVPRKHSPPRPTTRPGTPPISQSSEEMSPTPVDWRGL
jgi:hypothetical protein